MSYADSVRTILRRSRVWISFTLVLGLAISARAETSATRCALNWAQGNATSCQEAVAEDVKDLESWNNLARAYTVTGDDRRALKILKNITILTPDDPAAFYNYGATAGTLRRYDIAVEALRKAVELEPDSVTANLVLSIALDKLGRFDEAEVAKRAAAELGDEMAMFELAETYAAGGSKGISEGEARAWMERAAKMGHVSAMDWMADIYEEGLLGEKADPARAETWRQRARNAREQCC